MATNLDLDDKLINEVRRLGKYKTKRAAVNAALEEFVRNRRRLRLLELVGKIDYDPKYDYKAARRSKRL